MKVLAAIVLAVGSVLASPSDAVTAQLKPKTLDGFNRYIAATEARIHRQAADPGGFLYVDRLPEPQRSQAFAELNNGEVWMTPLVTRDSAGHEMTTPDGLIHHWLGTVFIPGATLTGTLKLLEDYNHYAEIYQPKIIGSRLLEHHDEEFKVYLRLRDHKVITETFNSEHEVHFDLIDPTHFRTASRSIRIAEVADADKPDEHELPVGRDHGFLWRINTYGSFVERDGGVYAQSESVTLTRDIPFGFAWLVKPFVTSIPRESLRHFLGATRTALMEHHN